MTKRNRKNTDVIKLSFIDAFIRSSGKMNRSMNIVKTGTGQHKNKKAYDRRRDKSQYERYGRDYL